jgi:hypothetical protein
MIRMKKRIRSTDTRRASLLAERRERLERQRLEREQAAQQVRREEDGDE